MTMRWLWMLAIGSALGCVTINIYFPEAQAEQAADRIIDKVRGTSADSKTSATLEPAVLARVAHSVGNFVLAAARAEEADFDASSPGKRALEESLQARFAKLKPYFDNGAVGLTAEGLVDFRDRNRVPLASRNEVRQWVADQNADWEAMYREIARINAHPDWVDNIRRVFAERWVAKADPGWYYRDAGGIWQQK
jgi:uncharacterized protein YdbL (DUF1318 family)